MSHRAAATSATPVKTGGCLRHSPPEADRNPANSANPRIPSLSPCRNGCVSAETAASRERVLSTAFPSGGPAIDNGRDAEPEHPEGHGPAGDTGHAVPPREFRPPGQHSCDRSYSPPGDARDGPIYIQRPGRRATSSRTEWNPSALSSSPVPARPGGHRSRNHRDARTAPPLPCSATDRPQIQAGSCSGHTPPLRDFKHPDDPVPGTGDRSGPRSGSQVRDGRHAAVHVARGSHPSGLAPYVPGSRPGIVSTGPNL
jgi:hypothetical protein